MEATIKHFEYYITDLVNGGLQREYPYYYSYATRLVYPYFDVSFKEGYEYTVKVDTDLTDLKLNIRLYKEDARVNVENQEALPSVFTSAFDPSWTAVTPDGTKFTLPSGWGDAYAYFSFEKEDKANVSPSDVRAVIISKRKVS